MKLKERTVAFVLKKIPHGEADYLFILFSKDYGKIEILGKGIRKISSKLKSQIDVLNFVEVEFVQGKFFNILTDAVLISKFKNSKNNLGKLKYLFKICELTESFIPFLEKEDDVFDLLKEVFERIEKQNIFQKITLLFISFFWKLLKFSGYGANFFNCLICSKKLKPNKNYWVFEKGGILCENCARETKSKIPLSENAIKILRFSEKPMMFMEKLKVKNSDLISLISITEKHNDFILKFLA